MINAWEYLHNITHVDHHFNVVDNTFILPEQLSDIWKWNTTPYQQSIQMFALMPIAFGLGYFLFYLVMVTCCCCCKCCRKKSRNSVNQNVMQEQLLNDKNSLNMHRVDSIDAQQNNDIYIPQQPQAHVQQQQEEEDVSIDPQSKKLTCCASVFRIIFSLLSICIIIVCIYIGYKLDNTIIDVQTNWDNSYKPYDECINYGHEIEHYLQNAIYQCDLIEKQPDVQDIIQDINYFKYVINQTINEVDGYLADGSTVSWGNSDDIDDYRYYAIYIGLSLLGLMAIQILISIFCISALTTMRKCFCANYILYIFLSICCLLIWILSSYQFAYSIEVSDICSSPQSSIIQAVNISGNQDINQNTYSIVEYYLYCDDQHSYNPLANSTTEAYNELIQMNATLMEFIAAGYPQKYNITNETYYLLYDYDTTINNLIIINQTLQCENINYYLNDIINDLCVNGINYWYLLYSFQVIIIILLIIRSYCICTKSEIDYNYSNKLMINNNLNVNNNNLNDNNNDVVPIINNNHQIQQKQIIINDNDDDDDIDIVNIMAVGEQEYNHKRSQLPFINAFTPGSGSGSVSISPEPQKDINKKKFNVSDNDIKKCIKYLLPFMDNDEILQKKSDKLIENGYNNDGNPLNDIIVRRALSVIKNYKLNQNEKHLHPLLQGLV